MKIALIPQMIVSSTKGWGELEAARPAVEKLFFQLVVPLSALPPAMLYYAGTRYGDALIQGFGARPWGLLALTFFLAEMVTFAAMGWLIKEIADTYKDVDTHKIEISLHDAYVVAAISPIPLWLSSLALLVPNLTFIAGTSIVALCISGAIIYHGIYAFCHMREEIVATSYTVSVMSAGLLAWVLLVMLAMLPI